jgi:hypothetical protein
MRQPCQKLTLFPHHFYIYESSRDEACLEFAKTISLSVTVHHAISESRKLRFGTHPKSFQKQTQMDIY